MKIIFDQGTPRLLRRFLTGHAVRTVAQMGWSRYDNGILLKTAESSFDVFITTDKNLRYQQQLHGRHLAILVLPTPDWNIVQLHANEVLGAVNSLRAGEYRELTW